MKTKNIIKFFIGLLAISELLNSCVNDNSDFQTPQISCQEPNITTTTSLLELKANAAGKIHQISDDIIVSGYVVSSDEQGNFFSSISIQNQDGTTGVKLSLDRRDIYTQLKVGQKVYLKAKGLYISNNDGDSDVALGALFNGNIGRLPDIEVDNFLFRSCDAVDESTLVHPASLSSISDAQLNTLVEYDNVQFRADEVTGNYFDPNNTIGSATNRYIVDENGKKLIVRNSQFADFANEPLPPGNGKIRGVLSKFNGVYQLFIRNTNDVQFTGKRKLWGFATNVTGTLTSIASLRNAYNNGSVKITDDDVIEGVITMSTQSGNITSRNAFIQDDSGAIVIRFDNKRHSLFEGYKVRVKVKDLSLGTYADLLQVSNVNQASSVQVLKVNAPMPATKTITIDELLSDAYQAQLVKIDNVQFTQTLVTFGGGRTVTDCVGSFPVFTSSFASFANNIIPSGNGSITGIASTFNGAQLLLRSVDDTANMTGKRCAQPEPFFTEDFESLVTGNGNPVNLTDWVDVDESGNSELWEARDFGGNKYAQASAFGVNTAMKTWLITPSVDLTGVVDPTFSFGYKQNYYNGDAVKVLISTDYNGVSTSPQNFNWTDITADVALTDNNPSGFMSNFSTSKSFDLSSYTGTVHVAFLYEGVSGGVTTNIQIDNLQFFGK